MLKLKKRMAYLLMLYFCGLCGYLATELINSLNCSFIVSCIILTITFSSTTWLGLNFKSIEELIEDDHLIKYGKDE